MNKEDKRILQKAGESITEKPLGSFDVAIRPNSWLHKIQMLLKLKPSKKTFEIRPQRYINIMRIASKSVIFDLGRHKIEEDKLGYLFDITHRHGKDIIYIVACIIQNNDKEPKKSLIKMVAENFELSDIHAVLLIGLNNYNLNSFISSIGLIVGVDALNPKTKPSPLTNVE